MKQGLVRLLYKFWQKVHGVDITHDNVCSSMLSCFYSYVQLLSTGRPISSLKHDYKVTSYCQHYPDLTLCIRICKLYTCCGMIFTSDKEVLFIWGVDILFLLFLPSGVRCPASDVRRHAWFPLI